MNSINRINQINQRELDNNVPDSGSWHMDYKESNYIFIGGINSKLKEKDLIVIFSQFGLPTHIKLVKNPDTGENKGFGYLKYADFRSCILAIDNMNGVVVYDKHIRVDHCWFQLRDDESEDSYVIDYDQLMPKPKEIEYKEETLHKSEIPKVEDELKDPMDELKGSINDDLEDPMDDDLADPMVGFIKKRKLGDKHRHKHKHRRRQDTD